MLGAQTPVAEPHAIYFDPDNGAPNTGNGTIGDPYTTLAGYTLAASNTPKDFVLARTNYTMSANLRASGSFGSSGRVRMIPWNRGDDRERGRTGAPTLTSTYLANITAANWERGRLNNPLSAQTWSADASGNVWRCNLGAVTSNGTVFIGLAQPQAGYPYGRWLNRRDLQNEVHEGGQAMTANYQWGRPSGGSVVVYSDSGVNPATRYGTFYLAYIPFTADDDGGTGGQLIRFRPDGGFQVLGIGFLRCQDSIVLRSAANVSPFNNCVVDNCFFETCYRAAYFVGAQSPNNSNTHLTQTGGFANLRYTRNFGRNLGDNMFHAGTCPNLPGALIAGNLVIGTGQCYGTGAFYNNGHTTDGSWIVFRRNYVEKTLMGNMWRSDGGMAFYGEEGNNDSWFDGNLIVDAQQGIMFNSTRGRGRATRNVLWNRIADYGNGINVSAFTTGAAGSYAGMTAARPTFDFDHNLAIGYNHLLHFRGTGFGSGSGVEYRMKQNILTRSGANTSAYLINADTSSALDEYIKLVGNQSYNFNANLIHYNASGGGNASNSLAIGHSTADPGPVADFITNNLITGDTLFERRFNPAQLLTPGTPRMYGVSRGLKLLSY